MVRLADWISATRPKTLAASAAPVAMGSAIAFGEGLFHLGTAITALVGALGVQVACNFANDYFDARQGADTAVRVGPVRAVASGLIAPRQMCAAAIFVIAAVVLPCAIVLAWRAGWPFIVLAALASVLAFAYTSGKHSIAYLGLGELFVLVFFGPVAVVATYAAQAMHWAWAPAVAGIGPGLLACAILSVNNLRDVVSDRAAGKRTLAVRLGVRFARAEYTGCVIASVVLIVAMAAWYRHLPLLVAAFAPLTLVGPVRRVLGGEAGAPLNDVLAASGRALLLYGGLFCVGWIR